MSTPGERLRAWRRAHDVTQEELAQCLDCGQTTISRLELGEYDAPCIEIFESMKSLMGSDCPWEHHAGMHQVEKRGRQGAK